MSGTAVTVDTTVYGKSHTNLNGKIVGYIVELAEPITYTVSHAGYEDTRTVRHVVVGQTVGGVLPSATLSATLSATPSAMLSATPPRPT